MSAQGGVAPYHWSHIEGHLPPGLKLHAHNGVISGLPTTPGEYHFTLAVTDSNVPHDQAQRELTILVIDGLTIDWKQPPHVQGNTLSGSAVVSNQTGHALDITVVVVGVNSIGRATTLGYQHFMLAAAEVEPGHPLRFESRTGHLHGARRRRRSSEEWPSHSPRQQADAG